MDDVKQSLLTEVALNMITAGILITLIANDDAPRLGDFKITGSIGEGTIKVHNIAIRLPDPEE